MPAAATAALDGGTKQSLTGSAIVSMMFPLRDPGRRCRGVARGVQHLPAPLIPRWPHPAEYLKKWTITQPALP